MVGQTTKLFATAHAFYKSDTPTVRTVMETMYYEYVKHVYIALQR